ncbi:hypothetical protein NC651_008094 [Populus alba x Populus x berolinensis]|nr:hypothetical protein NC651_008094 [Populus alba x Populus x berolinensis]
MGSLVPLQIIFKFFPSLLSASISPLTSMMLAYLKVFMPECLLFHFSSELLGMDGWVEVVYFVVCSY